MHLALVHPQLVSLAAGFVDQQTLPVEPTRTAVEAILSDPRRAQAALQYGTTPGYPRLRAMLLERLLAADRHVAGERKLSSDQVVVTAGSNQMLHLLCDTLLSPGDIVLCAAPSYFVFLGMLGNLGTRSLGVQIDADGMVPESLEDALRQCAKRGELNRVKAIYVTSYFDNPSSVTLSAERRARIVEIAKRWSARAGRIFVIEDAAYRELRYSGEDLPSMRSFDPEGDTVIVAETFSKSFSPGIRVGWGILPVDLVEPVCNQKGNIDFGSPNFSQHLMATILELGLFEPHVERLNANYRQKLAAMLAAADELLAPLPGVSWRCPTGGLYVWLTLPEGLDAGPNGPLFQCALDEGVLYVPGEYCHPTEGEPVRKNTIRLSFGVQDAAGIRRGVELLSKAIAKVSRLEVSTAGSV